MRRGAIGAAALILVGIAVWWAMRPTPNAASSERVEHEASGAVSTDATMVTDDGGSAEEVGADEEGAFPQPSDEEARRVVGEGLRRTLAEGFHERLRDARARRLGIAPAAPLPDDEDRVGRLEASYIQDSVRAVAPLIGECFDMAIEASEEEGQPLGDGRVVARFVIAGEPEVGGVVEESELMEESEISHPVLDECLRETLYTLELPAPEGGGRVTVHYPFVMRREAEE